MQYTFAPIGVLKTPFKEKFGVPRQSLLMTEAWGVLKLNADHQFALALRQLEQFSHVWLVFVFHKNSDASWHPLIDTPRVDMTEKVGVFATRSPHRPNPLGISAVKLERIDYTAAGGIEIYLNGVDLLDGTPILDIKPYLPYADYLPDANAGWAAGEIERYAVELSRESEDFLAGLASARYPNLRKLIIQMLELDPRPTSQRRAAPIGDLKTEAMRFAFRVWDFDVHWQVRSGKLFVHEIVFLASADKI